MSTPTAAVRTPLSGAQWGVLCLLVVSIFINYVDRGNLSIAGPLLMASPEKGGLGLDPARLGFRSGCSSGCPVELITQLTSDWQNFI